MNFSHQSWASACTGMYIQVRTHRLSTNTCVYSYAHTQALQIYRHMKNEQRKKEELKFEINTLHALAYHTVVVALGLTSIVLYRLKNILIPKSSEPPESQQFSTAIDTRSASLYCTKITIYVLFFFFFLPNLCDGQSWPSTPLGLDSNTSLDSGQNYEGIPKRTSVEKKTLPGIDVTFQQQPGHKQVPWRSCDICLPWETVVRLVRTDRAVLLSAY